MQEYQKKHKAVSLRQQWATLYVNWANMLRRQAVTSGSAGDRDTMLITEARKQLQQAENEDDGYLDRYWTGVRVSLSVGDYSEALSLIEKADQILSQPEKYNLNRLSYDKIGKAYTTWLRAVVLYYRSSNQDLLTNHILELSGVSMIQNRPVTSIYRFLKNVESTGLTINEDIEVLLRMADSAVLSRGISEATR